MERGTTRHKAGKRWGVEKTNVGKQQRKCWLGADVANQKNPHRHTNVRHQKRTHWGNLTGGGRKKNYKGMSSDHGAAL